MRLGFKLAAMGLLGTLHAALLPAATISISGGGTNVLRDAISLAAGGDVIEIADSAVYVEDYDSFHIGVWNLTIAAASGQTPSINFTSTTDHATSWIPNVGGLQVGDNDGGRITIRKRHGVAGPGYAVGGTWLPNNETITIENVLFTSTGANGPWDGTPVFAAIGTAGVGNFVIDNCLFSNMRDTGEAVIFGPPWVPTVNLTVSRCIFEQSTPSTALVGILGSSGANTAQVTVEDSWFRNYFRAVEVNAGSLDLVRTTIISPQSFGIYENATGNAKTINVDRSTFYDAPEGVHYIGVYGTGTTNVTVDHSDFLTANPNAPAITLFPSTTADVVVKNSNFGNSPQLWAFGPLGAGASATYNYNNLYGGGSVEAAWTDGGNNFPTPHAPDYANPPHSWAYTDTDLAVGDEFGGAIGSQGDFVPVELSAISVD